MRKSLETQQSHNAHISFGSEHADSFRKKKKKPPEIQLMGSIGARKLLPAAPNTKLLPLPLECSLIMTCLWA